MGWETEFRSLTGSVRPQQQRWTHPTPASSTVRIPETKLHRRQVWIQLKMSCLGAVLEQEPTHPQSCRFQTRALTNHPLLTKLQLQVQSLVRLAFSLQEDPYPTKDGIRKQTQILSELNKANFLYLLVSNPFAFHRLSGSPGWPLLPEGWVTPNPHFCTRLESFTM